MPLTLTPGEVALRLALTALAAGVLGLDREAAGNAAGMRTMLLVGLAASLAMVEANLLLNTVGKAPDSFAVLDLMRLPLGILTGIGFIGGGAILKRRDGVIGLTTAACLWFMTVVGLCFGAGLLVLGAAATAVGYAVLRGLKLIENRMRKERYVELTIKWTGSEFDYRAAFATLEHELEINSFVLKHDALNQSDELHCSLRSLRRPEDRSIPPAIMGLANAPGVLAWRWKD